MTDVTLALPSKGALSSPTLDFLKACGLKVWKPNPRQYTGTIPAVDDLNVMFQRVKDIVYKVADGTAQLGVTGLDVVHEHSDENVMVIHDDLKYGRCELVVAVPESWLDVENMADLADVALDIRQNQQRNLRVATTYTHSARQFLHEQGIHHFTLVKADGAIEAAPTLGYADVVVDLTQTGTTLRENRLKSLPDGVILSSQACLIGNKQALSEHPGILQTLQTMLELMDASMMAKRYSHLTANIQGESAKSVAARVMENPVTTGLHGPSIARVHGNQSENDMSWYAVTVVVKQHDLLAAIEHLRSIGGTQATTHPATFVFMQQSPTFQQLQQKLAELD